MDVRRTTRTIAAAALAAGLVALAISLPSLGAGAASVTEAKAVKYLWATVNICDTRKYPNRLGIRARMPGDGKPDRLRMRFFVEYMKGGRWVPVKVGGVSPWQDVGSGLYDYEEAGWTFHFTDLKPGDSYTMRGLVKFQWRRHGHAVRGAHAYTSAHHPTRYGDPPRYSKATCGMSGSV